jgi:hypothetical protein
MEWAIDRNIYRPFLPARKLEATARKEVIPGKAALQNAVREQPVYQQQPQQHQGGGS